jgi:hypothetical protein
MKPSKKIRPKRKKLPTTGKLKKAAWDLLSKIVRLTHSDGNTCECYTCGKLLFHKEAQAGHAIPGRTGAVLLDEEILRPQCVSCNVFGRGMYHIYSTKLIEENGMDWWKQKLANSKKIVKWDRVSLNEKIESYRERLNKLKELG